MFAAGRRLLITALVLAAGLWMAMSAGLHRSSAQSPQPGITLEDLGGVAVSGSDWTFAGDYQIGAGAWESVTISNYGYCFVGPNDPREGTAHAAGVYWFAELKPHTPPDGTYDGNLAPGRGGNVSGHVLVKSTSGPAGPTHVSAALAGSDISYYQGNTLEVCLLGAS